MAARRVRADYDALAQIAQGFDREAEKTRRTLNQLHRDLDALLDGDWVGRGATEFYHEMISEVLPAVKRLGDALEEAACKVRHISRIMKQAEDDSARLFTIDWGDYFSQRGRGAIPAYLADDPGPFGQLIQQFVQWVNITWQQLDQWWSGGASSPTPTLPPFTPTPTPTHTPTTAPTQTPTNTPTPTLTPRPTPTQTPTLTPTPTPVFAGDKTPNLPATPITGVSQEAIRAQQTLQVIQEKLGRPPTYGEIFIMTVGAEGFGSSSDKLTWPDGTEHTLGEFIKEGTIRTLYHKGALADGQELITRIAIDQPWSGEANEDPNDSGAMARANDRANDLLRLLTLYQNDPGMQAWVDEFLNHPGAASRGWAPDRAWNWFNKPSIDKSMGYGRDQVLWTGIASGSGLPITVFTWCQHPSHTCTDP